MKKTTILTTVLLGSVLLVSPTVLEATSKPGASDGSPALRDTTGQIIFETNTGPTNPVDPLDPKIPVTPVDPFDPEKPIEPGTNGPLSLDYASSLDFGRQKIVSEDMVYYAKTQEVKINKVSSQKPLYAQVTDGRGTLEGWTLGVKQNGQFKTDSGEELIGAQITFKNGQKETAMESPAPSTVTENVTLASDGATTHTLMAAEKDQAAGTWIYRLGDLTNMDKSVELSVPGKATKLKKTYTTTLTWSLSTTPGSAVGDN